jgi:hypothetical protein
MSSCVLNKGTISCRDEKVNLETSGRKSFAFQKSVSLISTIDTAANFRSRFSGSSLSGVFLRATPAALPV